MTRLLRRLGTPAAFCGCSVPLKTPDLREWSTEGSVESDQRIGLVTTGVRPSAVVTLACYRKIMTRRAPPHATKASSEAWVTPHCRDLTCYINHCTHRPRDLLNASRRSKEASLTSGQAQDRQQRDSSETSPHCCQDVREPLGQRSLKCACLLMLHYLIESLETVAPGASQPSLNGSRACES